MYNYLNLCIVFQETFILYYITFILYLYYIISGLIIIILSYKYPINIYHIVF